MDLEGESIRNSLGLKVGARATRKAHAAATTAADAAAKWLLGSGLVLAVLAALLGAVAPTFIFLVAMIYALASGIGLARYRAAPRAGRRLLLMPLTVLLLACWPAIVQSFDSGSITDVARQSSTLLVLFVMPVLIDLALQRAPAAHTYAVVVLAGAACFAASGLDILMAFFLIPAFALTTGFATARCAATGQHTASRLVFAASLGFGFAWLGLHLQCTSWHNLSQSEHAQWFVDYPADAAHYQTLMVAGFPIQMMEGHGGGGAREYLPWDKGLGVLLANYLICLTVAWLGSFAIPARGLIAATSAGIVFAITAGLAGWVRLLWMLD